LFRFRPAAAAAVAAAASRAESAAPDRHDPPLLAEEVAAAVAEAAARDGTRAEPVRCVALARFAVRARFAAPGNPSSSVRFE